MKIILLNLQIITVELSRGWNSRLGFSLRNDPNSMHTTISAIYNDSVAAKDGRLRVGDRILMVCRRRSFFSVIQISFSENILKFIYSLSSGQ